MSQVQARVPKPIVDEHGEAYYRLGMFAPSTWLKCDPGGELVQLISKDSNRALVQFYGESEPVRMPLGVEVQPVDDPDRELERAAMRREWVSSNAGRLERIAKRREPVILSKDPVSTSVPGGMFSHKSDCPVCGKSVWVTTANKFLPHGPAKARCAQSGREQQ